MIGSFDSMRRLAVVSAGVLALAGCSFSSDSLWPSLTGEPPSAEAPTTSVAIPASSGERSGSPLIGGPPPLGNTNFEISAPAPAQQTGTFVGEKVIQLRGDLIRLQDSIRGHNGTLQSLRQQTVQNAQNYHQSVASIESRLQVGTTPGNPQLVDQWNSAQRQLEQVNTDISNMNALANRVSADAALSTYLLESVRAAYGLSGAVEADHENLSVLEDETNQTVVLIDRLLTELSDDIRRQSSYAANERNDLNTMAVAIKNGELFGTSLANRSFGGGTSLAASPGANSIPAPSSAGLAGRRPLVVIRFDRPGVDYEQPLYSAIRRALERRPEAIFDVVAVSPQSANQGRAALDANQAKRNAQNVFRSLQELGLPPGRVALSAQSAPDARTNEVRIYVR
ncbi:MAG: hypothetical protein NXI18_09275 [Alphaproteobacteria bacterium]|nr:hypothetical protein [Alphaproteobacteria bacterium]